MHGNPFTEVPADGNVEPPEPYFVSLAETARMLGGITEREIYNRIEAGDLEAVKLGRRRLVVHESLVAYVERLREQERSKAVAGAA